METRSRPMPAEPIALAARRTHILESLLQYSLYGTLSVTHLVAVSFADCHESASAAPPGLPGPGPGSTRLERRCWHQRTRSETSDRCSRRQRPFENARERGAHDPANRTWVKARGAG